MALTATLINRHIAERIAALGENASEALALDSSDDDPEPPAATLQVRHGGSAHVRGGLFLAQSQTIAWESSAGGELGLYTNQIIERGSLVGVYTGNVFTAEAYEALPRAQRLQLDVYAVDAEHASGYSVVVSPPVLANGRPAPASFPLAYINESRVTPNCAFAFETIVLPVVESIVQAPPALVDADMLAVAVYATTAIGAGRELTIYYGDRYPRQYQAVRSRPLPKNRQHYGVLGSIPGSVASIIPGTESDVSDESDQEWGRSAPSKCRKAPPAAVYSKAKARKVDGSSSGAGSSSSTPPPAPPPAPAQVVEQPQAQLFGGSGDSEDDAKQRLPAEFLRFHNDRTVEIMKRGVGATMVDQAFASMGISTAVQKRAVEVADLLRGYDPNDPDVFLSDYQALEDEVTEIADPAWREQQTRKLRSADAVLLDYLSDQATGATIVFDLETTKLVDKRVPVDEMTVSVATALVLQPGRSPEEAKGSGLLFEFWNAQARRGAPLRFLAHLLTEARTVIAYNGMDFDLRVLSSQLSTTEQTIVGNKLMDTMAELERLTGLRMKLSTTLSANGLPPKAGSGSDAPGMWENGKYDDLALYCARGTVLLAELVSLPVIKLPQGGQTQNGTLLRHHALPIGDSDYSPPLPITPTPEARLAVPGRYEQPAQSRSQVACRVDGIP
eukprot:7012609-Prymnesium_polylepis.2